MLQFERASFILCKSMEIKTIIYIVLIFVSCCHAIKTVPFPPTLVRQPSQEKLFRVSEVHDEPTPPIIMECEVTGNPEPKYWWTKNGENFDYSNQARISQKSNEGTLIIYEPEDEDEGLYQCYAENVHGVSVSNGVQLRKSTFNPFPNKDSKIVRVIEGEPLSVTCEPPSGYPKLAIFWVFLMNVGTVHAVNNSRITVDPDGSIHFSNVTMEDVLVDARYCCVASSPFRHEYKLGNTIILEVEPSGNSTPKTFPLTKQYVSPSNIVSLRGQKLELSCIYGGTPVPEIKWFKNGQNLEEVQNPRISIQNFGKTLKIQDIDFQDEGTYECTANNGIGMPASQRMNVTVEATPFWIDVSSNNNIAEGENVTFECIAGGKPLPQVEWFMNGVPIDSVKKNPRRKLDRSSNTLTIEKLTKSDTAVFQCNASNAHGYAFHNFYMNILDLPPIITEKPEPITKSVETKTVNLRCRVFGVANTKVKWEKNGQKLSSNRSHVLENGDLEIIDILEEDEGNYTCYASNKFGDREAMRQLEVKRKTKIVLPPEDLKKFVLQSSKFQCSADVDASLELRIIWLFNGLLIDFDVNPRMVKTSDNSLIITKTYPWDSGEYTCVAKTELDRDEATAILIILDIPYPPEIIVVKCDDLKAFVEWQPTGDNNPPILNYDLQFNNSFTPDAWENVSQNIPATDTRFEVSLSPWTNYTFRIVARNEIGISLPSEHSDVCTTIEDIPYKNPENVVGWGTEKDNLVISWKEIPPIEQNAPRFFYRVFWKREDIPQLTWEMEEINNWRQNTLIIPNQPAFKPYRIKVEAHNMKGQAKVAAMQVMGYSGVDVPLEAPKNFRLLFIRNASSAKFYWDPVPPESIRGHCRGFKIQTWTVDEGEERLREEIVKANVTEALVTIFRPFSRNLVRVLAFNDMYNGPPSDVIEFSTPEGTPGPVANVDAIPLGSSALYLIWKRPFEPNGILTGYRIYYSEIPNTDIGKTFEHKLYIFDPTVTRAKLGGLKPQTKYRVTIIATARNGEGVPYFIDVKTNEQGESAPDVPEFIWSHLPDVDGKAGVRVTWVLSIEGHPGSHFYVQYRKKGETQWEGTPVEENQDSVVVTGLELGSLYEMKVVAVDGKFQTSSKVVQLLLVE